MVSPEGKHMTQCILGQWLLLHWPWESKMERLIERPLAKHLLVRFFWSLSPLLSASWESTQIQKNKNKKKSSNPLRETQWFSSKYSLPICRLPFWSQFHTPLQRPGLWPNISNHNYDQQLSSLIPSRKESPWLIKKSSPPQHPPHAAEATWLHGSTSFTRSKPVQLFKQLFNYSSHFYHDLQEHLKSAKTQRDRLLLPCDKQWAGVQDKLEALWHSITCRHNFAAEWLTRTIGCHYFRDNVICLIIWQHLSSAAGIIHKGRIRLKSSCRISRFAIPRRQSPCFRCSVCMVYISGNFHTPKPWRILRWYSLSILLCHMHHMISYFKII